MAEKKSFLLRLSPKMWEEINQLAEAEFRSVNGEIEYLLYESMTKKKKARKRKKKEQESEDQE